MSVKIRRTVLEWAKYYHDLGLKVIWLHRGSKAPIENAWQSKPRDDWETLERKYKPGFGIGICTGTPVEGGIVIVIDRDLKTDDPRHLAEANAIIDKWFPGLRNEAPFVASGRGFESAHFYAVSPILLPNKKLGRSTETVKVFSPTSKPQQDCIESGELTPEEVRQGWRIKAAWEVELFSLGKQVVAPPTLHADTKNPYVWKKGLEE